MSSFTFLTWNLCLFERPYSAPTTWTVEHTQARVREVVLEVRPDFVFFQELPGMVPFVETHAMVPANTKSHSGDLATLVKSRYEDQLSSKPLGSYCVLSEHAESGITFANVHLFPALTATGIA